MMYNNNSFHREKSKNNNLIYGIRAITEAINSGKDIDKVVFQRGISGQIFKDLFALVREKNIPFQYVPVERLNRYTRGNHQGAIAFVSPIPYQSIYDILPSIYENGHVPFLLLLDRVTDVRNMGAIVRSAECAGVDAVIIPSKNSAQINEDAIKTSAGALFSTPVCRHDNLVEIVEYLQQSGVQVLGCNEKASKNYYELNYTLPTCIVMGNEYEGIAPILAQACDHIISIPMAKNSVIDSLNVSVATGIMLFEVCRQRFMKK